MLQSLTIENIAVIESADINLETGMNVLTGETGAGKSIIIDAINAVLGERTSREIIRTGAQNAKVSAVFCNIGQDVKEMLAESGLDPQPDNSLILQRSVSSDGRSTCRVNGNPVTVTMLKNIGNLLVNIHGQHDSQALLSPEKHYTFIDKIAENQLLLSEYKEAYNHCRALKKELADTDTDEAQKVRRLDLLNYQIEELEAASLRVGEQKELTEKRDLFSNAEKIITRLSDALVALNGTDETDGAKQNLEFAADCLSQAAGYYSELEVPAQTIRGMSYDLEDYIITARNALEMLEYDPQELEFIEERLDVIYRLSRKYGETEEEMLDFLGQAKTEKEKIVLSDENAAKLRLELEKAWKELKQLGAKLTQSRITAGEKFAALVREELNFLDMPGVVFAVERRDAGFGPAGADEIEFLISANAGEEPRALARIASGGELSRIMLAIRNVLSAKDDVATLIFDEIDSGVSGRAAQKVAMKLKQVSKGRQVICVTHLAQIAAFADNHLLVKKSVRAGKTYTEVELLDLQGRKNELARIIGGLTVTEKQLASAEEMLNNAKLF